ncbi:monovalent cation/H(+) antiporter subunit G [Aestuariibacter salexigens]|uniref:monovalent cation/H(+) antiporter subunit G n=1 Tax=Aestuariibacter salexigens TaxID=226010 RepID=UPI00040FF734|nr:monovalent cation/H(+) antiporter subunit G [Aestuariibacter salexigens]
MSIINILSIVCLALGCFLSLIGGIGLIRLPDMFSRLHAVGVTDTLCTFLILFGLALQSGLTLVTVKLLFIFLFLLFTSPTSSFALASGAWHWGFRPLSENIETDNNDEGASK